MRTDEGRTGGRRMGWRREAGTRAASLALAAGLALGASAHAQTTRPAAFVANNGNLEGSVAVFFFNPDGSPQFVSRFVTGAQGTPGTNAYAISLAPSGDRLAVTHATAATVVEQLDILRVNADGTLSSGGVFQVPDSPLGAAWVSDELLAVTTTRTSGNNFVRLYRYDRAAQTLVETDNEPIAGFMASLAALPSAGLVFCPESTNETITVFRAEASGQLTQVGQVSNTPTFPLAPTVSPLGDRVYAFGGISNGGNRISGFSLDAASGAIASLGGSPFPVGGSSPKAGSVSADGALLLVGHGTDSTARLYRLDAAGVPTPTGWVFDVGIQGDLGSVAFLDVPGRRLALVTDKFNSNNGTGLLSFTVDATGNATQNGPVVSTQGPSPEFLAVWPGAAGDCYANCDGSTGNPLLTPADFVCFLNRFRAGDPYANCDGSTGTPALTPADFVCFLNRFRAGC